MNFGHTAKSTDLDAKNANNFEAANHSDSSENSWEQTVPIERDERAIGSKAIRSPEYIPNPNTEIAPPPEFGKVVNRTMPFVPANDSSNSEKFDPTSLNPNIIKFINPESIREENGRASKDTVKAIDQTIEEVLRGNLPIVELPKVRDNLSDTYRHGHSSPKIRSMQPSHKEAAW